MLFRSPGAKPIVPKKWPDITVMTTSYGHGIAASPMHLAAAYATIANGGIKVTPTLLHGGVPQNGPRIMSEQVAHDAIRMLRGVVREGTATLAEAEELALATTAARSSSAKTSSTGTWSSGRSPASTRAWPTTPGH